MPYSMLIDTTKCIGCQGCQVACKNWNDRPADRTTLGEDFGNPARLNAKTYTTVKFHEDAAGSVGRDALGAPRSRLHFAKQQCMQCLEPACVSACACGALKKSAPGPVVYDKNKCIGCRYCMLACPFGVPTFEWEKALPAIQKCQFCSDRINAGMEPACSKTCPSGALLFGKREDILRTAERRLSGRPGRYINHVYGKTEAGGTSILYISDTDFKNLSLPADLYNGSYADYSWSAISKTPVAALGAAALLAGFFFISGRKDKMDGGGK